MAHTTITALPTPPFSPSAYAPVPVPPHAHLLDALIAHYQRERMWVKHTQDLIAQARLHQFAGHLASPRDSSPESNGSGSGEPLWMRRKSRHSLRLRDLAHNKLSKRMLMHDACGTKVLELFAALLEARIESCKRVETLVLQSARARRFSRP